MTPAEQMYAQNTQTLEERDELLDRFGSVEQPERPSGEDGLRIGEARDGARLAERGPVDVAVQLVDGVRADPGPGALGPQRLPRRPGRPRERVRPARAPGPPDQDQ